MDIREQSFQMHVLLRLDEAEALLDGYQFRGLRTLIRERGAVAAANQLLDLANAGKTQDGFSILAQEELLHLSLEQAVIDFSESGLHARQRYARESSIFHHCDDTGP
jgi:hypothetical protein